MKTVLITGDERFTNIDIIMRDLDYLFRTKQLPPSFKVVTTGAAGVEAVVEPVMLDAGFDVTSYSEVPEHVNIVVVFFIEENTRAYEIMMNQWNNKKPVFPFKVQPS